MTETTPQDIDAVEPLAESDDVLWRIYDELAEHDYDNWVRGEGADGEAVYSF